MSLRVIITAALLVVAYSLTVTFLPRDLVRLGYGQKDNLVKVENVIYRSNMPRVILVGSSLTALLRDWMLPAEWGNLAIGAGSALTGVEIIKRSKLTPSVVVIEVNMLMRPADQELLNGVYGEPMHFFRNAFPALRLQNHPTTLLFSLVQRTKGEGVNVRTEEKFKLGLAYQKKAFAKALPKNVTSDRMKTFIEAVSFLRRAGIKVYLVRYPTSPEVSASPQMRGWLSAVKAHFKAPQFDWIEIPDESSFVTTDGLHIDTSGAMRMAEILKKYMEGATVSDQVLPLAPQ